MTKKSVNPKKKPAAKKPTVKRVIDKVNTNFDEILKNAVEHVQGWREE